VAAPAVVDSVTARSCERAPETFPKIFLLVSTTRTLTTLADVPPQTVYVDDVAVELSEIAAAAVIPEVLTAAAAGMSVASGFEAAAAAQAAAAAVTALYVTEIDEPAAALPVITPEIELVPAAAAVTLIQAYPPALKSEAESP